MTIKIRVHRHLWVFVGFIYLFVLLARWVSGRVYSGALVCFHHMSKRHHIIRVLFLLQLITLFASIFIIAELILALGTMQEYRHLFFLALVNVILSGLLLYSV
jgi:hypothetical protein